MYKSVLMEEGRRIESDDRGIHEKSGTLLGVEEEQVCECVCVCGVEGGKEVVVVRKELKRS